MSAHGDDVATILQREFPAEQIGKLPRSTCHDCSDAPNKVCSNHRKERCSTCGNYMTTAHIHLDYVGHAAATQRLLEADSSWTWRFFTPEEVAAIPPWAREVKGLWIYLTVDGVTRPGFGDAGTKSGPNAVKEAIGDAIRNAAMRFGVALDLWSKEDLKADRAAAEAQPAEAAPAAEPEPDRSQPFARGAKERGEKAKKRAAKKAVPAAPPAQVARTEGVEDVPLPEPPEEPAAATPAPPAELPKGDPANAAEALPAPDELPELGDDTAWYIGWAAECAVAKSPSDLTRLGEELKGHRAAKVLTQEHVLAITSWLRNRWQQMKADEAAEAQEAADAGA